MKLIVSMAAFVGSIILANVLTARYGQVDAGFGLLVTAGTFAAGFALVARDFVHKNGGLRYALAAIAIGTALSYAATRMMDTPPIVTPARLAFASALAFCAAELVDLLVYRKTSKRIGFETAIALSGIAAVPVDTILFLKISGFGLTWNALAGQLVGKLVWATAIPIVVFVIVEQSRRAVSVQPVD